MFAFGNILSYLLWLVTAVLVALFAIDRFITVPNVFGLVSRPSKLQTVTVDNTEIPISVLYLPPKDLSEKMKNAPVYVMFPGNPGVPEFYIETMRTVHDESNGAVHVYTVGHAGQGLTINDESMHAHSTAALATSLHPLARKTGMTIAGRETEFTTDAIPMKGNWPAVNLPRFDGDRLPSGVPLLGDEHVTFATSSFKPNTALSLRDQIAVKVSAIAMLRREHPHSKFVIAGNSMGGHLMLELLRTLDRVYVLHHHGVDGLTKYDELNLCSVEDVEGGELGVPLKRMQGNEIVESLPNFVTQILFDVEKLKQWVPLIEDAPKPDASVALDAAHSAHFIAQTQFLMCTIMRIADTPNGQFITWLLHQDTLVDIILRVVSSLPGFVKRALTVFNANPFAHPDVHATIRLLVNLPTFQSIATMAKQEMRDIRSLDTRLLHKHSERALFYMSETDGWAPMYIVDYLQALSEKWTSQGKTAHRVRIDQHGLKHAYMFGGSRILGKEVWLEAQSAFGMK